MFFAHQELYLTIFVLEIFFYKFSHFHINIIIKLKIKIQ